MLRYTIKRILIMIPVLLLTIFVVFGILSMTPGDPARIILGNDAPQADVDNLRTTMGLDRPLLVRYFDYVKNIVLHFDFGDSYRTKQPVFDSILAQFPTTLRLAIFSIIASTLIGLPLGVISAIKQYSAADISLTVGALLLASIPGFWLAIMLIMIFSIMLGVLPSTGVTSWKGYIMPVATLSLPVAAVLLRITRAQMLEVWKQDYIRTAKAKGASQRKVIWRHAVPNALMPVVTIVGLSFASLLGGTIIIESIFGVPGLGNMIITAIRMKDIPVVMGSTIFLATLFMIIMLLVDITYAFIDPRTRAQFKSDKRHVSRRKAVEKANA